jgi:hypothetical protein
VRACPKVKDVLALVTVPSTNTVAQLLVNSLVIHAVEHSKLWLPAEKLSVVRYRMIQKQRQLLQLAASPGVCGVVGENGHLAKELVMNVERHQEQEHVYLKAAVVLALELQRKSKNAKEQVFGMTGLFCNNAMILVELVVFLPSVEHVTAPTALVLVLQLKQNHVHLRHVFTQEIHVVELTQPVHIKARFNAGHCLNLPLLMHSLTVRHAVLQVVLGLNGLKLPVVLIHVGHVLK